MTSLNLAVRAEPPPDRLDGDKDPPGRAPKGPPEEKPEVLAKVHGIAILRVAEKAFKTVYGFVTDWKDFLSQFCLAPEEMWKSVRHTAKAQGLSEIDLDPDGNIGIFRDRIPSGLRRQLQQQCMPALRHGPRPGVSEALRRGGEKVLAAVTDAEQLVPHGPAGPRATPISALRDKLLYGRPICMLRRRRPAGASAQALAPIVRHHRHEAGDSAHAGLRCGTALAGPRLFCSPKAGS